MLTDTQLAVFSAALAAETDADLVALRDAGNTGGVAAWYNEDSSFWVWRTSVPVGEYRDALTWTEVDLLTAGKARIWEWLTGLMTLPLQPSKQAVRQGLADCWASNSATRPALIAISKRLATRGEEIFATGTGTEATPGDLVFEGSITNEDVIKALAV